MPPSIHITSPITGAGNRLDLELVAPLLANNGFKVSQYGVGGRGRKARTLQLVRTLLKSPLGFKMNIFMGPIFPEWFPTSRINAWIPNPEGVALKTRDYIPRVDVVLAKTRLTERIFQEMGKPVRFIGFTSRDHYVAGVKKDYTRFFHACSSPLKGTKRLLEIWQAHPDWPELVVVISNEDHVAAKITGPNIRMIAECLPAEEFAALQNGIGFHICCSEAEGFGHYIYEALSCGAIVLATDGAPMNEFAQETPALLLEVEDNQPELGLAHRYYFKESSLAAQVQRAMSMDAAECERISTSSRAFFLENDRTFCANFPEVVRSLIG
jgi:glycosyltransferase involved in cell wall biosynthesis